MRALQDCPRHILEAVRSRAYSEGHRHPAFLHPLRQVYLFAQLSKAVCDRTSNCPLQSHRFLADRFVEGTCPFCAYDVSLSCGTVLFWMSLDCFFDVGCTWRSMRQVQQAHQCYRAQGMQALTLQGLCLIKNYGNLAVQRPRCKVCSKEPEIRTSQHLFLDLAKVTCRP